MSACHRPGSLPLLGLALSTLLAVVPAGPAVAQRESLDLIEALLAGTGAERTSCTAELLRGQDAQDAVCAAAGTDLKRLRKSVRAATRGRDEVVPLPGEEWTAADGFHETRFFVARELFVIRFDEASGRLALLPHRSCFARPMLEGTADARGAGIAPADIERRVEPDYPPEAREERRPGFVMTQVVVGIDGSVARACVLWAGPPGYGFEANALAAVRAWRFRPATRDGETVPFLLNVPLTWQR